MFPTDLTAPSPFKCVPAPSGALPVVALPGLARRTFWRAVARIRNDKTEPAPIVLTVDEACRALRVSKWSLYQLIRSGKLETVKIGSRRVVPVTALHVLVAKLRDEGAW
jgi:excisionase family DNA binding protein